MKYYTYSDAYFEVRKVNEDLFRIFYCENETSRLDKKYEEMITSKTSEKSANKIASHFQRIYNLGHSKGSY